MNADETRDDRFTVPSLGLRLSRSLMTARRWCGEGAGHDAAGGSEPVTDVDRRRHADGRDPGDGGVYVAGAGTGEAG